jgi:hypothetical protein
LAVLLDKSQESGAVLRIARSLGAPSEIFGCLEWCFRHCFFVDGSKKKAPLAFGFQRGENRKAGAEGAIPFISTKLSRQRHRVI